MSALGVSLLMPVRNGAAHLPPTLASLRKLRGVQQIVIVDDGSQDETPALLARAAREDRRIQVIRQPPGGIVAALNRGLSACEGDWIARLDADDVAHPARVERSLAVAEARDLDVIGTGVRCFPTQRIRAGLRRYEAWQNSLWTRQQIAAQRFVESPLVHPSVLMRRAVVEARGGYRMAGWPEDYDLWLRLLNDGVRIGKTPEILTFWRDHSRRLTRTAAYCAAQAVAACKAHHLVRGPLAGGRPYWVAGTGPDGKRLVLALVALGRPPSGWLD
ncbi:MAG: glycosyltransferase, partial [Myxococcales bacterium]|nr:glycosyltransferase [Myxococcales bacterium]